MDASTAAALAALGAGLLATIVVQERRHTRLRRRLRRFERAETELLRVRRLVYTDRLQRHLAALGRTPHLPPAFPSQFGEDMLLWDLFDGKLDGFFIEVGAHDGHSDAVTLPFEAAGWTGLLIEPMPDRYAECAAFRKRSRVVHAALSKQGATGTARLEVLAAGEGEPEVAHLSTHELKGVYTKQYTHKTRVVEAPLMTMDSLLETQKWPGGNVSGGSGPGIGAIDFAIIDVEGAELDLLDGFDLASWRPRVLLIEDLSMGALDQIKRHVEAKGYTQVMWFAYNRVFIRSDEKSLIARAHDLAANVPFPSRGED